MIRNFFTRAVGTWYWVAPGGRVHFVYVSTVHMPGCDRPRRGVERSK